MVSKESRMYMSKCTSLLHYTFPILLNILNLFSGPGNSSTDEYLEGNVRDSRNSTPLYNSGTKSSHRKPT